MRRDSVWILKMRGTETEGTFGSLKAAMQSAYWLTDAAIGADEIVNAERLLEACRKQHGCGHSTCVLCS